MEDGKSLLLFCEDQRRYFASCPIGEACVGDYVELVTAPGTFFEVLDSYRDFDGSVEKLISRANHIYPVSKVLSVRWEAARDADS